jgi:hypothetical protein
MEGLPEGRAVPAGDPSPERAEAAWRRCVRAGVGATLFASLGIGFEVDPHLPHGRDWPPGASAVTMAGAAACIAVVATAWRKARFAYRRTARLPHFTGKDGAFHCGVQIGGTGSFGTVARGEVADLGDGIEVRYDPLAYHGRWIPLLLCLPWLLAAFGPRFGVVAPGPGLPLGLFIPQFVFLGSLAVGRGLRPRFREVHPIATVHRLVVFHDGLVFDGAVGRTVLRLRTATRVEAMRIARLFEDRVPSVDAEDLEAAAGRRPRDEDDPGPSARDPVPGC